MVRHLAEYRYTTLHVTLLLLLLLAPFLPHLQSGFSISSFLFLGVVVAGLRTIQLPRRVYLSGAALAVLAFAADLLGIQWSFSLFGQSPELVKFLVFLVLIGLTIIRLMKHIFSEGCITMDTLRGGVSVYLLMGLFWALIFGAIGLVAPEAFAGRGLGTSKEWFIYFSFTTLTTLGYGDIVPSNDFVRILTSLEAIMGQIFLGVFIARLVGIKVAQEVLSQQQEASREE